MLRTYRALSCILSVYLLLGALYTMRTAAWQAPDEPAHYNYVRQLAAGSFPRMEAGDYNQAVQSAAISAQFAPPHTIEAFEYEDYQPPLYYLLLTPIFKLTGGTLVYMRFLSVLLGAGVVVLGYLIGRKTLPHHIALTATLFVAFLPQHLAILSSINNDALAELIVAALFYCLLVHPKKTAPLALLLGLALLTKVTAYLMAGAIGITFLWRYWGDWRTFLQKSIRVYLPATLIGCLWWGRNLVVYGGFDFLGIQAHDQIVVGQMTSEAWITQYGLSDLVSRFFRTTFFSFWGQFGWMSSPFPIFIYYPLLIITLLALIGLVWHLHKAHRLAEKERYQLVVLSSFVGFNLLLYLVYNLQFVQHQGRYFFVSLIPISIGVGLGWATWWGKIPLQSKWFALLLPLGVGTGLIALNGYALLRIIPCLSYVAC